MIGASRTQRRFCFFLICLVMTAILLGGCAHLDEDLDVGLRFRDANSFFNKGSYQASLKEYEQIILKYPAKGDVALFEMGIVNLYPKNEQKDLNKALECFDKVAKYYPESSLRQSSEMMILYIKSSAAKDVKAAPDQANFEMFRQELRGKETEIMSLQRELKSLDRRFVSFAARNRLVDKIVVEKKQHRLSVLSKGDLVKTYKIALGGNPNGPKEREGDNKTPEGTYQIDTRNYNSYYHLSLHLTYPNERDRKWAKKLGVAPGGGISIHGLHGFMHAGDLSTAVDWTDGCIAVSNEAIEELDQLVPNGTVVEIKP